MVKNEIAELARSAPAGIVNSKIASSAWGKDISTASKRLSALASRGWLRRMRRGTYEIIPLDAMSTTSSPYDDPWTLAATEFEPCYVGGWSAAEHWGLTEQIFRDTFVVTAANVRSTQVTIGGLSFRLTRVAPDRALGDEKVWRRAIQVPCSSAERTLVDAANSPFWIGGVRHLADVITRYAERPSNDLDAFIRSLKSQTRGAGAKRLGYIAEQLVKDETDERARETLAFIRDSAHEYRTKGVIKLDPSVRSRGHMNTAWGLWINTGVVRRDHT